MKALYKLVETASTIHISKHSDIAKIIPGCVTYAEDTCPKTLQRFDNELDALDALKGYTTQMRVVDAYAIGGHDVIVTEYAISKETYDDDDEDFDYPNDFEEIAYSPIVDDIRIFGHTYHYAPTLFTSWIDIEDK